jgi:hypothetical protein
MPAHIELNRHLTIKKTKAPPSSAQKPPTQHIRLYIKHTPPIL